MAISVNRFILIIIALTGCAKSLDIEENPSALRVLVYSKDHPWNDNRVEVKQGDAIYDSIMFWLNKSDRVWKPSYQTYVPVILFSSDKLSLNLIIQSDLAVLNYQKRSGRWVQVVSSIPDEIIMVLDKELEKIVPKRK